MSKDVKEMRELAKQIRGGRVFQAEGAARAKVPHWDWVLRVLFVPTT